MNFVNKIINISLFNNIFSNIDLFLWKIIDTKQIKGYTFGMKDSNAQLKIALQNFGFGEKESLVYLALLELGHGTVTEISRKAGINRTTGYDILSSLANKGLASISGKEPKSEFAAEPPQAITNYLKKVAERTVEQIKKSEELIPELNLLHAKQNRPRIKFYEGVEGLKQVYEDTLNSTETIRAYANAGEVHKGIPNYFPEYFKRRARKNISIRAIFPQTEAGIERASFDTEEKREVAFVPADRYNFSPEINIYDNKVMIASWQEKLGVIIESAEIADAMKKIYELAWAEAKRLDASMKLAKAKPEESVI
ncbi:MAG: helix-turn-helix domain-containing protein [Patescibacteria group bacterium]